MTLSKYIIKYKNDKNTVFYPNFITYNISIISIWHNIQIFKNEEQKLFSEYLLISANFNYDLILYIY